MVQNLYRLELLSEPTQGQLASAAKYRATCVSYGLNRLLLEVDPPVLAYMFDPVWLVNIVILALLDCTANAKGAFHPRQEQLNGAELCLAWPGNQEERALWKAAGHPALYEWHETPPGPQDYTRRATAPAGRPSNHRVS